MKNKEIYIGCSSYNTASWQKLFYPEDIPRSKWFEYYCKHFNTYELNSTFYKFPTVRILQNWYKKAPEGFLYSAKVPKIITHIKRLADCQDEINEFYSVLREGLADKLGCVLFQLPPSFSYTPERLDLVINAVNTEFSNAVEFRNESWWIPEVFDTLTANNITFCSVNYPKIPTELVETIPLVYLRLHGNPRLFYSEYSSEEIKNYAEAIKKAKADKCFVYFNNTADTGAIINAQEMKELLK
ncbi:MAG: DUF72 domain-containing protein [Flavobacterium sp.]|nr:MAG: DUF72 domain-containing protein [Flavobacterium sp.]